MRVRSRGKTLEYKKMQTDKASVKPYLENRIMKLILKVSKMIMIRHPRPTEMLEKKLTQVSKTNLEPDF